MKPHALLLLLALPFFAASQYTYQGLQVALLGKDSAARPYTFENLRLYPVHARPSFRSQFRNVGNYLPLPEAIRQKKVRITEKGNGGEVSSLTIENRGGDTVIVTCGDVVKGGQQDRIVEEDLVLAPRSGRKTLKVFCVEAGRWHEGRSDAPGRRATVSNQEHTASFSNHYNKGSMSLRKVVEKDKDQGKVWQKVEELNTKNSTVTDTKTYTALTRSGNYSRSLQQYVDFFRNRFARDTAVIGVIVVTGNKVLGCDLFATPALFRSQFASLLHSYATEAILNGSKVTVAPAVVKTYSDRLLKDEASQSAFLKEKGSAFTDRGRKLRVSVYE